MARLIILALTLMPACSPEFRWRDLPTAERAELVCATADAAAQAWSGAGHSLQVNECGPTGARFSSGAELNIRDEVEVCAGVRADGCAEGLNIWINGGAFDGATPNNAAVGLTWIFAHELGHTLNYRHASNPRVMRPNSSWVENEGFPALSIESQI